MTKYYGPIKNANQAKSLVAKLRLISTPETLGAANLLEGNWHMVAARPELATRIVALATKSAQ